MLVDVVHIGDLLTTALGVVSIATLAGLGLLRGTVTNLRENLKDSRDEITDKERRMAEMEKTIAEQQGDLKALGRVVTGEAHWNELSNSMDEHHQAAMRRLDRVEEQIKRVLRELEDKT